jgi:ABC-type nitrate/sulfonate/bicarbonate transport system substrate-binding protein
MYAKHHGRRALRCIVLVALLLPLLRTAPVSAQPVTLKVGISEAVNTVLAIWMADAAGLYAANGIQAEIINMSGGSRGARELAAGRLDAMHVGLSSVVRVNREGNDLRVIASLANVIRFTLCSAPGVTTAAALKGGVVGVSTFGSESQTTVLLALERLGLTENDVILKEYGGGGRRIAALKSGEIKATAVNEPASSLAREQGLHVLFDLVPERIPWLFTGIVVRRDQIVGRRDVLTRFIKATAEGNYIALTDERRAKEVLAKQANIADPRILDITYSDFKALSPPNIEPTDAAAINVINQFPSGTFGSSAIADYVDVGILDDLKKQGVFTALQQMYRR